MSTHAKAAPGGGQGPARPEPVTPTLLRAWPLPGGGSGKDDRGSVLVIGGARMTPGAVLLAGVAALRSGAGRLTLAVAESVAVPLAVALPEAGVLRLPETASGTVKGSSVAAVLAGPDRGLLRRCDAAPCIRLFLADDPRRHHCSATCGTRVRAARLRERRAASSPG